MTQPFTFSVRGVPRPQPRPRFSGGRVVSTADRHAKLWRSFVDAAVRRAMTLRGDPAPLFTGPVRLRCEFTFVPPPGAADRLGKPHTHKPDASNLLKLVEDVMETAGVFANDSQVAEAVPIKRWGERPGLVVLVEPISAAAASPDARGASAPDWLTQARPAAA